MKKFYDLNRDEKIKYLFENKLIDAKSYNILLNEIILSQENANKIIENQIGIFGLPYGVARNFKINNQEILIPMVCEEPSVIAACSNGAKIIGNFKTYSIKKLVIGQIITLNKYELIKKILKDEKNNLMALANVAYPSIVKRGGGIKKIILKKVSNNKKVFNTIFIYMDCKEAMGANIINTVLEKMSKYLKDKYNLNILMSILSNYNTNAFASAYCEIDFNKIDKNNGKEIAEKIVLANEYANLDKYRTATNNKGVMNGIESLMIACGNDNRSINASIYNHLIYGKRKTITNWFIKKNKLCGKISLPISCASVGGSIKLNDMVYVSFNLLNNPSSTKLAEIACCVGLSQNFAALKSLVSNGIQSGHMKMQARIIANNISSNKEEVKYIINKMIENKNFNSLYAQEILNELRRK